MPAEHALANDYNRCRLINLGDDTGHGGPFAISQTAYDPEDARMSETVFLLGRECTWVDQLALAKVPHERQLDFFYVSSGEAMKVMASLNGAPVIERYELTEQDLRERVAAWSVGGFQQRVKAIVERFRDSQRPK